MTLTAETSDRLQPLLAAMFDDRLSDEQTGDLRLLMRNNPAARREYVRHAITHAMLQWISTPPEVELGNRRSEQNRSGIDSRETENDERTEPVPTPAPTFLSTTLHDTLGLFPEGMPLAYLIATVVTGLGILVASHVYMSRPEQVVRNSVPSVVAEPASVGRITSAVDCNWNGGSRVSLGQKLDLASGFMEIAYDTGAKVILQGPVTYEVESNGGYLSVGKLTGKLEKKVASGQWPVASKSPNLQISKSQNSESLATSHWPLFTIRTPTATVTDLGTEFGVEVNREGITDMHVFAGSVRMAMAGDQSGNAKEQIVPAGNSVRADSGHHRIAVIKPSEQRFVRNLAQYATAGRADAYADLVLSMQPVAYYRMERPKDPKDAMVVFDSAPGGHHGTLHLGDEYGGDPWIAGRFGNALYLRGEGPGDGVDVQDFPTTDTNQLSVSAWVYCAQCARWGKIVNEADWRYSEGTGPWQFHFGLYDSDGDLMAGVRQHDGTEIRVREGASKRFPLGTWQHVAFVADGVILHLYRNGVEVAAVPCNGIFPVPPVKHLTIGCQNGIYLSDPVEMFKPVAFWKGRLDEIAIFYRALSAKQIRQLVQQEPGK